MKSFFYLLFSIFLMLVSLNSFAQVGIGTDTPAPSAALEVTSSANNKGILIPRITSTQKDAINNPAEGLLIYQTSAPAGFYYYTGTAWKLMITQTDQDLNILSATAALALKVNVADTASMLTNRFARDTASLSSRINSSVPYTGAKKAVDLGVFDLRVNTLTVGKGGGNKANNTAIGNIALYSNTTGNNNVANGYGALRANTTGNYNTANGSVSLYSNTTGGFNTANGTSSLQNNTTGGSNTANGESALISNTTGGFNTAQGVNSLLANKTGSGNTAIGYNADVASAALTNATAIGASAKVSANNTIQLGADGTNGTTAISNVKTSGTITAGAVTYPNTDGTVGQVLTSNANGIPTWSVATSSGIPYSGATSAVDLGAYDLKVNNLTVGKGGGGIALNTAIGNNTLQSNTTGTSNTATGSSALYANTTGNYNTANGTFALQNNKTGGSNTANGFYALYQNTTGLANTANGESALTSNTTGGFNSAHGVNSLYANTTGSNNTAHGFFALLSNTIGTGNTALGYNADVASGALTNATAIGVGAIVSASNTIQLGNTAVTNVKTSGTITSGAVTYPKIDGAAGQVLTANANGIPTWAAASGGGIPYSGATSAVDLGAYDLKVNNLTVGKGGGGIVFNTAIGNNTLQSNTTGTSNTATGSSALYANTTGNYNTANGKGALSANESGWFNTANGSNALYSNTTGFFNTANGTSALEGNTVGEANTANGTNALRFNRTGSSNTANGSGALFYNETGSKNTAIGVNTLRTNTTGSNNTAIGYNADVASAALTNAIAIGAGAKVSASNTIQLGADGTNGTTAISNVKTSGSITAGVVTYPNTDGTAGQVLTANSNGIPTWETASSGSTGVDLTTDQSVGGLKTFTSNDGLMATGTFGSGTASSLGAGTRMLWYPKKSAFRAGNFSINQVDHANIGDYSIAMGQRTLSSGLASIAMGYQTTASEQFSTAMGNNTTASGFASTAMGYQTTASEQFSTAIGNSTTASGFASTAMGQSSIASGNRSTALGYSSTASGEYSNSIGSWTTASGKYSTAMGTTARAEGLSSIAMGDNIFALSFAETVIGTTSDTYTPVSTIAFNAADRLFVIGNGENGVAHNALVMLKNGTTTFSGSVTAPSFPTSSDKRLKRNIAPLQNSVAAIMQLKPVSYEKKSDLASTDYSIKENGFIAQELQKIMPNVVIEGTDKDKLLSVNYTALIPVLTKALQEQQNAIQAQQKVNQDQQKINQDLQKQIEELKLLIFSMKK